MNLPNKWTVFRVLLVPVLIIVGYVGAYASRGTLFLGVPVYMWIMNLIFVIASITDKLDGTIARKRNLVTNFGKFLDPIADKILVLAALIMLVELRKIPAWIPIIVAFREFLVSGYRLIAAKEGGKVIAASIWGKLKTVTQMIAIILIFMDKFSYFDFARSTVRVEMSVPFLVINVLASVILTISVVATLFSGYDYLKDGKDLLKDA